MTQNTFTAADGSTLGYRIKGETGPWLILCHALLASSEQWAGPLETLSDSFRVVCPDTRGHGLSRDATPAETVAQMSDDVLALMDHLGIEKAHLLGASMSGVMAQDFASRYPERVEKLILANTTWRYGPEGHAAWQARIDTARADGLGPVVEGTLARFLTEEFHAGQPARVETLRRAMMASAVEGFCGCCRSLDGADLTKALPRITAPTLLIAGESDIATTPQVMTDLSALIPGSELVVLPGAHLCNYQSPDLFDATLRRFLA